MPSHYKHSKQLSIQNTLPRHHPDAEECSDYKPDKTYFTYINNRVVKRFKKN